MIGTDEMSSAGMDISESFRPEDISKTDFFDFVSAPDMGIGLGVNVNIHHTHHNHHHHNHLTLTQQQQHHHHHHQQHQHHHQHQPQSHQQHHHAPQSHHSTESCNMTHDGGGGSGGASSATSGGDSHGDTSGLSDGSSASTTDPTLHGYEFWTSDKEHTSNIFEDLDRYCWQQQTSTTSTTTSASASNPNIISNNNSSSQMHESSPPAHHLNQLHSSLVNSTSPRNHHSPATPTSTTAPSTTVSQQTQLASDGSISNIISTDGQIYTLTVLNGNEPWLKREADSHLQSSLDFDSLLGTFPGYIKSEYPYEDSGFSTDGCKDLNSDSASILGGNSHRLPSLINTIPSVTSTGSGVTNDGSAVSLSISQQLDQFHNNNNDWHMTDHNNEQNSAESLLRSALQGKGYTKGIHMHNGLTLMPSSPSVKDEDMRRILFPVDTDGLSFSDASLSSAQIFDDTQNANSHNPHMIVPHSPVSNGPLTPVANVANGGNNNNSSNNQTNTMMVDDMFLTLENAFSDDFEKIKQFCSTASANEYTGNEVMMQISPSGTGGTQAASQQLTTLAVTTSQQHQQQQQQQQLHATSASTSTPNSIRNAMIANQVQQQIAPAVPQPQPLKPEVTTSTHRIGSAAKITKKYKRTLSTHNSNSNSSVNNHSDATPNNTSSKVQGNLPLPNGTRNGTASSGSSTTSSNSPTHCNGVAGGGTAVAAGSSTSTSNSSTSTTGQRKERSLHYCSICSKGFKDKYSVNVHIRTHTGEKPFACTLCGKSFRQKAHLAKHYQTHMAQKNNGNLVKGNSNKHHRSSAALSASVSQQHQQQPGLNPSSLGHNHTRPLTISTGATTPPSLVPHSVGLVNGILSTSAAGLTLGVTTSGPTTPTTPTTILPPSNSLMANR